MNIKVGIIGCGGIAKGKHLPTIKSIGGVDIIAFCDILVERADEAKKLYGTEDAHIYTDYKELLDKETDIVAIYVCTPNRTHSIISMDALRAGKHVLCEKPMAKTAKEAREMVKVAKDTKKILMIGYQNRYSASSRYLKKCCVEGELGEIYHAVAHAVRRRAVPTWGVFLNEYEQGGGPLIDIGTHALDLTLWMMDNYEPEMVVGSTYKKLNNKECQGNAWGDWDINEYTVEDSAFGFIKMKNGATIYLESSWALNDADPREAQCTLYGTKGGADFRDGLRLNYIKHNTQVIEKPNMTIAGAQFFDGKTVQPKEVEGKAFIDAITKGTDIIVKPEQACVVSEILEAIYQSSKTGKPIYFN